MKNRILISVLFFIIGALIAIGPFTLFKVCDASEMIMKCHWSARAEIGIGIIIAAAGVFYFFLKDWQARLVISGLSLVVSIVAILIPAVLIGGCGNKMMACRSLSFPSLYLISILSGLIAFGNSIYLLKRVKGNDNVGK